MNKLTTLLEVQEYLYSFRTKVLKEDLERKFNFSKALARKLGNPQQKIKVIHAAGTSGKGSTCAVMSQLVHHGPRSVSAYPLTCMIFASVVRLTVRLLMKKPFAHTSMKSIHSLRK
jgi:hypothetical protein